MTKIKAIRGMNDILPEQTPVWQYLEATIKRVVGTYGYSEIRMPVVEQTDLFKRSIGEVTDIVEKEMYTFDDRNGESLTLRPEGTACCVRAGEEHGLLYNQTQRMWYMGPMFRYEKPQKGRYRQFHQLGVEAFGMASADVDAELILLTAELWRQLGMSDAVTLQLNSLGSNAARAEYRDALVAYLRSHFDELDEDSQRRLDSNPLRVLDSKNEATRVVLEQAPVLADYLDEESARDFKLLCDILDAAGVAYEVNPYLVRGLDYYCKTVFEWVTDELGAQGTVCAGGRYDGLVKQLGGKPTPAVGFAMGMERMILLLEALELVPDSARQTFDLYLAAEHKGIQTDLILIAEQLRSAVPGLRVRTHCAGLKNIATKARQTGAPAIVLLKKLGEGQLQGSLWSEDETEYDLSPEQLKARLQVLFGDETTVITE